MYNMHVKDVDVNFTIPTNGTGYWSDVVKEVKVIKLALDFDEPNFGELRVYFDPNTWNNEHDGLIYTDELFIDDLRGVLDVTGFDDSDVSYSEQGMQGDDYVSFDVGESFIESWGFKEWADSELAGK